MGTLWDVVETRRQGYPCPGRWSWSLVLVVCSSLPAERRAGKPTRPGHAGRTAVWATGHMALCSAKLCLPQTNTEEQAFLERERRKTLKLASFPAETLSGIIMPYFVRNEHGAIRTREAYIVGDEWYGLSSSVGETVYGYSVIIDICQPRNMAYETDKGLARTRHEPT